MVGWMVQPGPGPRIFGAAILGAESVRKTNGMPNKSALVAARRTS